VKIQSMGRNGNRRFLAPLGMTVLGSAARVVVAGLAVVVKLAVVVGLVVAAANRRQQDHPERA